MNSPSPCYIRRVPASLALLFATLSSPAMLAQGSDSDSEIVELSPFEVNTQKDVGYYAGNSISATKTNVPLQDLPMNVQVMTRTFLDDVNATDIESVMSYAASANPATNEPGRFALRGFVNPNPMRNGIDTLSESNFVSTITLDRIEVVKGPAAILYGITEPGGLINMITKKPKFEQMGELKLQVGDYSTVQSSVDFTGPLGGEDAMVAYRLVAGYSTIGYQSDYAEDKTVTIAPSLTFRLSPKTSLNLAYEYQDLKSNPASGAILKLSSTNQRIGFVQPDHYNLPVTFNHQGPDAHKNTETSFLSADFQHSSSDDRFAFRAVVNKTKTFLDQDTRIGAGAERSGSDGQLGWVNVHALDRQVDRDELAFQSELTGRFDIGDTVHRFLVGYEKTVFEQDQVARRQNNVVPRMNLKDPTVWDFTIPVAAENRALTPADFFTEQDTWSFYGVYQAELLSSRLHTLLGLRYDVVDSSTLNRRTTPGSLGVVPTSKSWTPQYGALFDLTKELGIFASYSESFTPNTSVNPDGSQFDPATGEGKDIGLKYNATNGRFNATLSFFDISKVGIVRQDTDRRNNDPLGGLWFIGSGEERSKGYEADIIMTPVENWQVTVSYAYIDAKVVANADNPSQEGNAVGESPKQNFAMWNKYSFTDGPLNGFYVGVGVNKRGEAKLSPDANNLLVSYPAYTAVDFVLGYRTKSETYPVEFALRVDNVTDELYMARNRVFANGRNVQFTAKMSF